MFARRVLSDNFTATHISPKFKVNGNSTQFSQWILRTTEKYFWKERRIQIDRENFLMVLQTLTSMWCECDMLWTFIEHYLFNSRTALHFILIFLAVLQICVLILKHLYVNNDRLKKFTQCFEYRKSFSSLFENSEHKDEISSIHGIKVLACFSVILYHTVFWRIVYFISSNYKSLKMNVLTFHQLDFMVVSVVEPFFVVSGILTARSVMKELKR